MLYQFQLKNGKLVINNVYIKIPWNVLYRIMSRNHLKIDHCKSNGTEEGWSMKKCWKKNEIKNINSEIINKISDK